MEPVKNRFSKIVNDCQSEQENEIVEDKRSKKIIKQTQKLQKKNQKIIHSTNNNKGQYTIISNHNNQSKIPQIYNQDIIKSRSNYENFQKSTNNKRKHKPQKKFQFNQMYTKNHQQNNQKKNNNFPYNKRTPTNNQTNKKDGELYLDQKSEQKNENQEEKIPFHTKQQMFTFNYLANQNKNTIQKQNQKQKLYQKSQKESQRNKKKLNQLGSQTNQYDQSKEDFQLNDQILSRNISSQSNHYLQSNQDEFQKNQSYSRGVLQNIRSLDQTEQMRSNHKTTIQNSEQIKHEESSLWNISQSSESQSQAEKQKDNSFILQRRAYCELSQQLKQGDLSIIKKQQFQDQSLEQNYTSNLSTHLNKDDENQNIISQLNIKNEQNEKIVVKNNNQNSINLSMNNFQQSSLSMNQEDRKNILKFISIYKTQNKIVKIDNQMISLHIKIQCTNLSKLWIKKISIPCFGVKNLIINKTINNYQKFVSLKTNWTKFTINKQNSKQQGSINLCQILDPYRIIKLYHQSIDNKQMFQKYQQNKAFEIQLKNSIQKMSKILQFSSYESIKQKEEVNFGDQVCKKKNKKNDFNNIKQRQLYSGLLSSGFNFLKIEQIKVSCRACYKKSKPLFLDDQNFQRIICQNEKCLLSMNAQITQQNISPVQE